MVDTDGTYVCSANDPEPPKTRPQFPEAYPISATPWQTGTVLLSGNAGFTEIDRRGEVVGHLPAEHLDWPIEGTNAIGGVRQTTGSDRWICFSARAFDPTPSDEPPVATLRTRQPDGSLVTGSLYKSSEACSAVYLLDRRSLELSMLMPGMPFGTFEASKERFIWLEHESSTSCKLRIEPLGGNASSISFKTHLHHVCRISVDPSGTRALLSGGVRSRRPVVLVDLEGCTATNLPTRGGGAVWCSTTQFLFYAVEARLVLFDLLVESGEIVFTNPQWTPPGGRFIEDLGSWTAQPRVSPSGTWATWSCTDRDEEGALQGARTAVINLRTGSNRIIPHKRLAVPF
ncbi:MAG: hypothetical protein OES69_13530 [Myxococcales bacterium]|nr:hypothetical protein [Myxococcales bacterium]